MSCKWHQQDDCMAWTFIVSGRKKKERKKKERKKLRERVWHCLQQQSESVCLTVDKACTVREMTKLWGRGREVGRQRRRKWKWQARVSDGERKQTSEDESARGRERSVSASPSRRKEQGRGVGESTPCSEWMSSFSPPRTHPSIPLFTGGYAWAAQRWSWDLLSKTEAVWESSSVLGDNTLHL